MENYGLFFNMFSLAYYKFYNPSEHLEVDRVIAHSNG